MTLTATTTAARQGSSSAMSHASNGIPPKHLNRVQDNPQQQQTSFSWPSVMLTGQSLNPTAPSLLWQQSQQNSSNPVSTAHSQSFNVAHAPSPFDPASFMQQNLMQEFIRLSTPVGQSPDDDTILAQALFQSKQNGKTYRQALEGLHGVNNHAANLWKDYYLDHHGRIEILVSRLAQQPKTIKKPFTGSISPPRIQPKTSSSQLTQKRKSPPTPAPPPSLPKRRIVVAPKQSQHKRVSHIPPTHTTARPSKRPRATLNSLSAPIVTTGIRGLPLPHADIPVPEPPSRSPSPPTEILLGTHGNRYTPEDRDYFIKFLTWRLKHDPSLTKKQLCDQLAEKAPHHSATSWASHWHSRHDVADKILATYRRTADEESDDLASDLGSTDSRKSRSQYRDSSDSETWSDFDFDAATEDDEAEMGEPGTGFTRGDWCVLARFIARTDWHEMTPKERFDMFVETYDTDRSAKAWGEFYRKREDALLKLAKKYSKRKRKSDDIHSRRARPSWAQGRGDSNGLIPTDEEAESDDDDDVNP
ncbi:hypothetical protein J3A83DRAFT_4245584 [Scleroderma citrinum]